MVIISDKVIEEDRFLLDEREHKLRFSINDSKCLQKSSIKQNISMSGIIVSFVQSKVNTNSMISHFKTTAITYLLRRTQVTYRDKDRSQTLLRMDVPTLHLFIVDLCDEESFKKIKNDLGEKPLNLLIHNAGYFPFLANRFNQGIDQEDWLKAFQVHCTGPIILTKLLIDSLKKEEGSKIVTICSRRASNQNNIKDNYNGRYGYSTSKAAQLSAFTTLARELKNDKIIVINLHPGRLKTEMTNYDPDGIEPDESAEKIVNVITKASVKDSGAFMDEEGNLLPF